MLSFSANLTLLFTEVDFLGRFPKAAAAGFRGIECQFPYSVRAADVAEQLDRYNLVMVLHNLPAGDWGRGERGIACLPDRVQEFEDGVGRAIEYATAVRCPRVNCIAGVAAVGVPQTRLHDTFVRNLQFAARQLRDAGIALLIEPLNTRDLPGFFLRTSEQALHIIEQVGSDNLYLQYDVYHMHVMGEDVNAALKLNLTHIAHVQVADDPGRHEPGTGTIDYRSVFAILQGANYRHWIGCEYNPLRTTEDSLKWLSLL